MLSLFSLFSIYLSSPSINYFFFFNDTATTEIYTLSLHDALPISCRRLTSGNPAGRTSASKSARWPAAPAHRWPPHRSEEHTSELQSHLNLVCRLLLEKKKKYKNQNINKNRYLTVSEISS